MTSKRGPKAEEKISSTMDKNLRVYALAAFAAGVGITALSTTAEAGVVYTPTYRQITDVTGSLPIDFNHDGVQDVHLSAKFVVTGGSGFFSFRGTLLAVGDNGNGFLEDLAHPTSFVAANPPGNPIGPGKPFGSGQRNMAVCNHLAYVHSGQTTTTYYASGGWVKVTNAYLGVKFTIQGQTHYGWARVTSLNNNSNFCDASGALTGYAYETVPDRPIRAGATMSDETVTEIVEDAPYSSQSGKRQSNKETEHGTLGKLASGVTR